MNLKMIEKIIAIIRKYIDISNLTVEQLEDLISEAILKLIIAYRKYKSVSPSLEIKVVKGAICYFLRKLKMEKVLKEKLRKEVMNFLRAQGLGGILIEENNKEEENGS